MQARWLTYKGFYNDTNDDNGNCGGSDDREDTVTQNTDKISTKKLF